MMTSYFAGVPRADDHVRYHPLDPALTAHSHPYQRHLRLSGARLQVRNGAASATWWCVVK